MKLQRIGSRGLAALLAAGVLAMGGSPAAAQDGPFPPLPQAAHQVEADLDQLLAPVALYPDALLAQVLAASTYPLEVVSLQRWLERNPGLAGDDLEQALVAQPWDPAVKALAHFRPVVAMMNGELEWTQRLGDAFLARDADVMEAVQRLRRKARAAGSLADNERERVVLDGDTIVIESVVPEVVYVPVYDPRVVYGPWWWPAYPPYVWGGAYFGPWDYVVGGIAFGLGVRLRPAWRGHVRPDWRHRHLVDRRPGPPAAWRHDPVHRGGVPYTDRRARDRYGTVDRERVRTRQDFRGFGVGPAPRAAPSPQRAPAGPSGLAPGPRGQERAHSDRGRESLRGPRPNPTPSRPRERR